MNVQELYQQKLTTAEEAVKIVKSGDWVDYGWCCNQPVALDKALAARKDELFDVKIHGGVTMWMPEVCKADDAGGILQVIRKIQFRDIQPRALKQAGKAGVSLVPRHVKAMRELAGVFLQYR